MMWGRYQIVCDFTVFDTTLHKAAFFISVKVGWPCLVQWNDDTAFLAALF